MGGTPREPPIRLDHRNLSVVYVIAGVVAVFSAWIPGRFLEYATLASVLNNASIACLVAMSLLLPLAAGLFDFSIGYSLGLTAVVVAWLLGNTGLGVPLSVLVAVSVAVAVGAVNGVVVVVFRVDSFIGTLATGSLMFAMILLVTGDQLLTEGVQSPSFANIAQASWHQLTIPVAYAVVVALVLWVFLGHTAPGRRVHATGLSFEAARLAGVRTHLVRFSTLVASATIAGFAGVVQTAQIGAGSPQVGPPFLIPAYAAAYLGMTQSRKGLFNTFGTVASVLLLSTTTAGLALAGAPIWAPYIVTGAVLIAAIGLANAASVQTWLAAGRFASRRRPRRQSVQPQEGSVE